MKKIVSLLIASILCFSLFPTALAAAPELNNESESIPKTMTGYLTDDEGNTQLVTGHLVETSTPKSSALKQNALSVLDSKRSSSDENLKSATYAFSLYSTTNHSDTASGSDGALCSTVYLTINYNIINTHVAQYRLNSVSGHWKVASPARVASATLKYGCTGLNIDKFGVTQTRTRSVSNYFSYNSGFTSYVADFNGSVAGALLTVNYKMGTSRTWSFTIYNLCLSRGAL